MALLSRARLLARRPDATALASLSLVAAIVFWPLLFGGQAYFLGDLELYFYPLSDFWHRSWVAGRVPLWNPGSFGGAAFAGNPQIGLLYPPSIVAAFFPTIPALTAGVALHVWGSGALFYGWMRRGREALGAPAALLGALSWMLGGALLLKAQFPNMLAALAWLPAVLWGAEALASRPTLRATTILGAMLGVQLLAAHAQVSLFSLYLAFFYALWVWKTERKSPLWHLAAGWVGALFLAALLDAGQLLPVLECVRGAERQTLSLQSAPRFVLPPWAMSNLFAPFFFGNPANGTWTGAGGGNFWETACYVGIVPFLLAIGALHRGRFWSLTAGAALLLALGPTGGLYIAVYYGLPGVARFHDAARFLMIAGLAFSILAARRAQALQLQKGRGLMIALLLLSALDLSWWARGVYPTRPNDKIAPRTIPAWQRDTLVESRQARVWCATLRDGHDSLISHGDYRVRTPEHDAIFLDALVPNMQLWSDRLEAGGYDPITSHAASTRLRTLQIAPDATQMPPDYALKLSRDSIRLVSFWRDKPLAPCAGMTLIERSAPLVRGRRLLVFRNEHPFPRARWSADERFFNASGGSPNAGEIAPGAAFITGETANSVELEVPARAREVELADTFTPDWTAFEGTRELRVTPTERSFRRVVLGSPTALQARRVRFVYRPASWKLGVFASLCALCATVALLVASAGKPRGL